MGIRQGACPVCKHPAGTLASNSKYQSMSNALSEIQRKHPDWEAKITDNHVNSEIKALYRDNSFYGRRGSYITYRTGGNEINFYSYYFDSTRNKQNAIQDIKKLGFTLKSQTKDVTTFEGKGNISKVTIYDYGDHFSVDVWL